MTDKQRYGKTIQQMIKPIKDNKMKKYFMLPAALLLALTACNNEEEATGNSGENTPVSFTADIAGQQTTRAYDQIWENGDKIGISGTSGDVTYTNVAYETTNGDGNFTIVPGGTTIYYRTTDAVTFTAYYPWNNLATGVTTIPADTREQSAQKGFDFLRAQGTGSKASMNVAFSFAHKMAKLALTIKPGTGVSYDEVKTARLMLSGYLYKGSFNVTTGTSTAEAETPTEYKPFADKDDTGKAYNAPSATDEVKQTVTYSLILFPQSFDTASGMTFEAVLGQTLSTQLDFTTANRDAGDADPKNELVAGRQYNLSIVLNKKEATVTGCEISAWKNANGGEFNAN